MAEPEKLILPDIIFTFPIEFPDEIIKEILSDIQVPGVDIKVHKSVIDTHLNASRLTWTLPTVIEVLLLQSYFRGFLGEADKEHYHKLKRTLKKTANDARLMKTTDIYSSLSPEKKLSKDTQSRAFSIFFQTDDGKNIKLMFDNDLSKENWDDAIDMIFEYIIVNYEKKSKDELSNPLQDLSDEDMIIYATIDKTTKKIVFHDKRKD
jgi:hypothetical protein